MKDGGGNVRETAGVPARKLCGRSSGKRLHLFFFFFELVCHSHPRQEEVKVWVRD